MAPDSALEGHGVAQPRCWRFDGQRMTSGELCGYLSIHRGSLYDLLKAGKIPISWSVLITASIANPSKSGAI
jgi:hypothetical protein